MAKSKGQQKKNLMTQITVVIVLIAFAAFFIFSNIFKSNEPVSRDLENAMNNRSAYSFVKEGEVSFSGSNGEFIRRIDVEIADDDQQRATGLMFRDKMDEDQGMLFLFDEEMPQSFWMKNTILPLDIMYVNSKMEIVTIIRNAKPYDDTSLPSVKPAMYVVEVNAGFCEKFGIKEGDRIVWRRN
ncbi:MAG: DUF192 domain-containing protein [Melioribacteraceae bacterium]